MRKKRLPKAILHWIALLPPRVGIIPLVGLVVCLWLCGIAGAQPVRTVVLGQNGLSWSGGGDGIDPEYLIGALARAKVDTGNAPGDAIDYEARPGWISPLLFTADTNVASRVLLEGGNISAPNSLLRPRSVVNGQLEGVVNGDHLTAYERKPTPFVPDANANGIVIVLDFGTPLGVERVRFYPRNTVEATASRPFEADFLRGFELLVNPVQTSALKAPDILVERRPRNEEVVVDIAVPPQYARIVKLRSLVETPFEIDEIEVYGTGYLQSARYQTDLIDLGDRATVGRVRWVSDVVGRPQFSTLAARVRSGNDATPILYYRLIKGAFSNPDVRIEVSGDEYWALDRTERESLEDDAENWSTWRSAENGELVIAPGPRRYIQFQFDFAGELFDTRRVGRLEFDYLQPPIADTLVAEVFPRLAEAEKPASFRYAARLRANGPVRGFDRLEVDTNIAVDQVRDLKINGRDVAFDIESITRNGFTIAFPLVQTDGDLLEFTFDLPIFRFGSTFSGRAFNSRFPQVPQILASGNAQSFGPGDFDELSGLAVAIPRKQVGKLVGEIIFSGRVLTPNGDGANDEVEIFFNLLQLTRPTPVFMDIFDLAGRRVHTVFAEERSIGPALFTWDGRMGDGGLLPPGNYIWVLRVKADAFEERHSGVIALAY
jgi:hypothetical protein